MNEQVAVVIGGASGLGAATARALQGEGYRVTVADQDSEGAQSIATELGCTAASVDVTDEDQVAALFDDVHAREGAVHAVVNTAGMSSWSPLVDHDVQQWRIVVDVNLVGAFIVLKHAGRVVVDGGALVLLSSLNARQPGDGLSAYCSAKAGVSMLTQVAALELAPRQVRVNAIAPGLVITPLTEAAQTVPGVTEDYVENTPLSRVGTPGEIADAAVYLCSSRAAWITGEVLDINGGAHMMRYPALGRHIAALRSLSD